MSEVDITPEAIGRLALRLRENHKEPVEELRENDEFAAADTLCALASRVMVLEGWLEIAGEDVAMAQIRARETALREAAEACSEINTTGRVHGPNGVQSAILALIGKPTT
tara:strand:- start:2751 stop:3080 length:330 start_codon:yes stop_codon:yes gene_type:complete